VHVKKQKRDKSGFHRRSACLLVTCLITKSKKWFGKGM
jgi:hypothetical protein